MVTHGLFLWFNLRYRTCGRPPKNKDVVGTLLELQSQLGHVVVDLLLLLHLVVDARIRVHHGGVSR